MNIIEKSNTENKYYISQISKELGYDIQGLLDGIDGDIIGIEKITHNVKFKFGIIPQYQTGLSFITNSIFLRAFINKILGKDIFHHKNPDNTPFEYIYYKSLFIYIDIIMRDGKILKSFYDKKEFFYQLLSIINVVMPENGYRILTDDKKIMLLIINYIFDIDINELEYIVVINSNGNKEDWSIKNILKNFKV